jgi:hypothetical protein
MLHDFVEIALQHIRDFADLRTPFSIKVCAS